jgi:hypothetical protein
MVKNTIEVENTESIDHELEVKFVRKIADVQVELGHLALNVSMPLYLDHAIAALGERADNAVHLPFFEWEGNAYVCSINRKDRLEQIELHLTFLKNNLETCIEMLKKLV